MTAFATIITPDYLHYALALRESLIKFNSDINFYILVTDKNDKFKEEVEKRYSGLTVLFADDLCKGGIGKKIYDRYFSDLKDEFRWSMKPVLIMHLLKELKYKKVLCLDCDLFFFNSYDFLLDKLETSNVILTPHWRSTSPELDIAQFRVLFTHGLFNAGFIGANNKSLDTLSWWAKVCEFTCVKDAKYGFYVDQGFLDALPVYFDNIEIIKHRGCNVAEWNMVECKRTKSENGEVVINNKYPIVFIHFATFTILNIIGSKDPLLREHLKIYAKALIKYNNQCDIIKEYEIKLENKRKQEKEKELLAHKANRKPSLPAVISGYVKKIVINVTPPLIIKLYTKLR